MEKSAFECIGFDDKLVRVQFWSIPVVHDETKENEKKGTNHLSDEEIRECYCFEEKRVPKDIDITIIAAHTPNSNHQALLLMRFHKGTDDSQSFAKPFYDHVFEASKVQQTRITKKDDVKESNTTPKGAYAVGSTDGSNIVKVKECNKVGKSGYEVHRTGGSGGRTMNIVKDGLVRFLQHHQTGTPRRVKALKILQKRTSYEIYYISPYNDRRHAATCHYTPPRRGGSFKLHPKLFKRFPFLMEFAVAKIRATMILKTLHNHSASYEIATLSWQQELEHIHCSINLTCLITNHCERHLAIISMYSSFNF